jgi:hypothetical protein
MEAAARSSSPSKLPHEASETDLHFPIVAIMPPSRDVAIADMRAVAKAIEGAYAHHTRTGAQRSTAEAEFYAEEQAEHAPGSRRINASEEVVEASVVKDGEIGADALEMVGGRTKVRLSFQCEIRLPFLVVHLKDIGKFCAFGVVCEARDGTELTLELRSNASLARVSSSKAVLPLILRPGWNYCCLDVEDIVHTAFGKVLALTTRVTVESSCRVSKVFFQDKRYEDRELPEFLRVIR